MKYLKVNCHDLRDPSGPAPIFRWRQVPACDLMLVLWRIHTRWISSYINRPNCYVCTYTPNSY